VDVISLKVEAPACNSSVGAGHRNSGEDRAVRDKVNASMQSSQEHCSMSALIVELGNVEVVSSSLIGSL
jgi:hypothetical protein